MEGLVEAFGIAQLAEMAESGLVRSKSGALRWKGRLSRLRRELLAVDRSKDSRREKLKAKMLLRQQFRAEKDLELVGTRSTGTARRKR